MTDRLKRQTKRRHSVGAYPLLIVLLNLIAILPLFPAYRHWIAADWRVKAGHLSAIALVLGSAFLVRRREQRRRDAEQAEYEAALEATRVELQAMLARARARLSPNVWAP